MRRSGITSRSKWASFSRNQTSCSSTGPRGPAVMMFWLSATGAPALVVSFFFSVMSFSSPGLAAALGFLGADLPASFLRTALADAPDLDVRGDDAAELLHGVGDAKRVELGALEVPRQPAAHADVVVVVLEVGVEAHALAARAQRGDEPEVVEQPQRPVDGVERHRRHPRLDRAEDGLGVRVLQARGDLAEDLEALVRQLDAGVPGGRLELLEPTHDLGTFHSHEEFPSANRL